MAVALEATNPLVSVTSDWKNSVQEGILAFSLSGCVFPAGPPALWLSSRIRNVLGASDCNNSRRSTLAGPVNCPGCVAKNGKLK